jgi:hypothetical protein
MKVKTIYGLGVVTGQDGKGSFEVRFLKSDFIKKDKTLDIEAWSKLSKNNGPCIFKWFKESEIERL